MEKLNNSSNLNKNERISKITEKISMIQVISYTLLRQAQTLQIT